MGNHKYQTRSVTMKRKKVAPFQLLSLPDDLITSVLARVCEEDLRDLGHMKMTCNTLRRMAERRTFYNSVDLVRMNPPWVRKEVARAFYSNCHDSGNVAATFCKGMEDFLFNGRRKEGIVGIKAAADAGLDIAKYSYGMIWRSFRENGDNTLFGAYEFSRGYASQLCKKLSNLVQWGVRRGLPKWFKPRRDFTDPRNNSKCGCMDYDPWLGRFDHSGKEDDLCDQCFWELQTEFFCVKISQAFITWPCY